MIQCLIVDDEQLARSELRYLLKEYPKINIVGEAENALEALKICEQERVDLMFIDIAMPKINGLELAHIVKSKENAPIIIFVTAYDEFAIQAFKVNACDYLLKPVDKVQFEQTILNKVYPRSTKDVRMLLDHTMSLTKTLKQEGIRKSLVPKLTVSLDDKFIPLNYSKIIYITVEDRDTIVYTRDQGYIINKSLNDLHNYLDDIRFFRSHKSFIINTHYIEIIEPWFNATLRLKLRGIKEPVPVSRTYVKDFKSMMSIE